MAFGHRSAEPGHQLILESLSASPIVDAGLRLGRPAVPDSTATNPSSHCTAQPNGRFAEAAVPDRDH